MSKELSRGWRAERSLPQMTLGRFISEFEKLPQDKEIENVCEPHSYRGYYSDLALEKPVLPKKFKMKQIKAIPKLVFDEHFTDKEFKYYDYACFISILDIDNNEEKFDKSIDNFLQVKMWDIEEDLFENGELKYEKPNDNELKKIVDFINKHKDKSVFMVHCSAGISRSGAVATFLYDKFLSEIDKVQFRRENKYIRPNLYILKRLKSLDAAVLE